MKLNRNNADIENLRDKKVAVRLVGKDAEIDFRKWLEENGVHFNNNEELLIRKGIRTEICYCVEGNSWDWCDEKWFVEKGYSLYKWEIAEEEKIYTIKDVVENEGKIYRSTNDCIYKYDKTDLYFKSIWGLSEPWKKTGLTLGEIIKLTFIEYKPEPKKITFKEAFKEMEEGNVCRCLFSNRCITVCGSHFFDDSNREFTSLSLPELQSEWTVVIGE